MNTRKSLVWHRKRPKCSSKSIAMTKALTQAFRISAEALDVGHHEWDFSAVQKNSTDTWIQFDRHFHWVRYESCHAILIVRSAEPWMFGKLEGENKVQHCRNEKELASFSQLQTARWFWKPIHSLLIVMKLLILLRLWCFCHERVPKWLQMVVHYDLSHRK